MPELTPGGANERARLSAGKKIMFALAACLVVPAVLLALAEFALRITGYGYPTSFFMERTIANERYLTENDKFGWRFFPKELSRSPTPTRFKRQKAPGTVRIFLFGESAALGDPKPAYGMGRYLEVLLRGRYPSTNFEVITVAMTAVNSHAILPIARECAKLHGDFWVVYMGNNEIVGPFGANPISGPTAPSIGRVRALLALRSTRVGQALESGLRSLRGSENKPSWEGMKTFLAHQVSPAAPERAQVRESFRRNLEDILRLARSAGARPVVCTVLGNLKDCAPFASMHAVELPEAKRQEIESALKSASNKVEQLREFAAADPGYAELQFRIGEAALLEGDATTARERFEKARDFDALPFRTDAALNETIRDVARSATLLDLEQAFSSGPAVPGEEMFFDHVHFTFEGNYRVARLMAETIAPALAGGNGAEWFTMERCDRELALTAWNRRSACEQMLQRLSEPPFTTQSNHSAREESLARQVLAFRASASPEARVIYEEAVLRSPDDFRLRENYSEFLELSGDIAGAARQWEFVAELLPYEHAPFFHIGRLYAREKKYDAARDALQRALALRPDLAEAMIELGQIAYRERKPAEALKYYEDAVKLRPNDSRLRISQADAFAASGDRGAAIEKLREAVALRPDHWEAHYLLGIELAATNRLSDAAREFEVVTKLRPDYAQAHFNFGVALAKGGMIKEAYLEFRKTVALDPNHKAASEYLRMIEGASKKQ